VWFKLLIHRKSGLLVTAKSTCHGIFDTFGDHASETALQDTTFHEPFMGHCTNGLGMSHVFAHRLFCDGN
jgi:hypothetical protein